MLMIRQSLNQNQIQNVSEHKGGAPTHIPTKTLIQLPTKQEMERMQSKERLNANNTNSTSNFDKQFETNKRKSIIPKPRTDNSVKSLSIKHKKQHEFSKFELVSGSASGKGVVPPERLIKIIAPLKRHKSNKSSKKIDNGEEE